MTILETFYNLCLPSKLYMILGIILLIVSYYHDLKTNDEEKICLGNLKCAIKNKPAYYAFNLTFILFWAWLLNLLCRYGWVKTAWFIFIFPYIIIFLVLILITKMVVSIAKTQGR
jgi:hypothetical protein